MQCGVRRLERSLNAGPSAKRAAWPTLRALGLELASGSCGGREAKRAKKNSGRGEKHDHDKHPLQTRDSSPLKTCDQKEEDKKNVFFR